MRMTAANGSPSVRTPERPSARLRPSLLQQAVVAFVLVLMGSLGAGLLLAAAIMSGLD
jgi:hypothetical protein